MSRCPWPSTPSAPPPARTVRLPGGSAASLALEGTLDELEKKRVVEVMERCGWVQVRACKVLGVTARQLGYKLKKYKIAYKPTIL
jgi:Nif-specific regulatory protein